MNTIQELIENGIDIKTADKMLHDYIARIGTLNGIYKIIDINYDVELRGKDVAMQCIKCGKIIHRKMISGRNKWSELIKTCDCQKEAKRHGDISVSKKTPKIKKDIACNDRTAVKLKYDDSFLGRKKNFLEIIGMGRMPNGYRAFICECDCGNVIKINPTHWERGIVKSCGCKRNELLREQNIKHGNSGNRLYRVWSSMKSRCYNVNNSSYANYGGRGITVCQEWLDDFEVFSEWAIENGYDFYAQHGKCTIDRINNDGNYEPGNCRWTDMKEQRKNQRDRKPKELAIDGTQRPLTEWYEFYGITAPAVAYRVKVLGMTREDAIKKPKYT